MSRLVIHLFGGFQIRLGSAAVTEFASNKVRALLAYLAVESNRPHARESLADLLWPESSQADALASLRNALANLRRSIGDHDVDPPFLIITTETIQFNTASDYFLDIVEILRLSEGPHHLPISHQLDHLQRRAAALNVYQGPFLQGFIIADSDVFEAWATLWRERLARAVLEELCWLANYYETCGEYSQALEYAQRQLDIEPWLEEGHRQVMRILAKSGQRSAALAQYESCRHILLNELGVEPAAETQNLYQVICSGELDTLRFGQNLPAPGEPPYRGLRFFDAPDSANFFGRETMTKRLVERVLQMQQRANPQLAVVGTSGSGKSSLVRAGVAPVLRQLGWTVEVITPTTHPLQVLETLDCKGLLVIDQFEELFSQCRDEREREAFLEFVFGSSKPVLLVMRADFYAHCAPYPRLRDVLGTRQEYIGAMDFAGLRRAIEEPARRAGWELEPGLVDLILRDVGMSGPHSPPEPGGLPLLEHALLETWQRRRGRVLTLEGYAEAGGVRGAIAQTADRVFSALSPEDQNLARKVFLRLTELGENTQDTRRRAAFSELRALGVSGPAVENLLDILAQARLLTLREDTAEVSHEALIREWPALQGWLSEDRDGLRLQRHLTESAEAWDRLGRDEGDLYRGVRLARALEWVAQAEHAQDMTWLEREFLQASQERDEREALEREAQRQRALEAAQKVAEAERRRAEEHEQAALRFYLDSQLSYARELAAHSKTKLVLEPDLSTLLALEAVAVLKKAGLPVPWDVQQSIHDVALTSRLVWRKSIPGAQTHQGLFAPDGRRVYGEAHYNLINSKVLMPGEETGEDFFSVPTDSDVIYLNSKVFALDADTGEDLFFIQSNSNGLGFAGDGKYLVAAKFDDLQLGLWDARSGQRMLSIPLPFTKDPFYVIMNAVSPSGRYVLINVDPATGYLIDLEPWFAAGEPAGLVMDLPMKRIDNCSWWCCSVAFSPDSKTFTTGSEKDFAVMLWDVETVKPLRTFTGHIDSPRIDSFSPDGSRLATCGSDNIIRIWEVDTARERMRLSGHSLGMHSVYFSPDGKYLASSGNDALVLLWDANSGQRLMEIHPGGPAYTAVFQPGGERLFVSTIVGIVSMWDISRSGPGELCTVARTHPANWVLSSRDGSRIVEARADGTIVLLETTAFQEMARLFVGSAPCSAIAPGIDLNNKHLAVDIGGRICVWNIPTEQIWMDQPVEDGWERKYVFSPTFSADGTLLATGGYSGKINVWNLVTGKKEFVFSIRLGAVVKCCQFSLNGMYMAVACFANENANGGITWIWNLEEPGKPPLPLKTDLYGSTFLWFSPDNRYLACCGNDPESRIWDVVTGEVHLVLSGHAGVNSTIQYSPDGRYLVTASCDGTVKVWEGESGAELLSYALSKESCNLNAFFTPDGQGVVVFSNDGCYRLLAFQNFDDLLEIVQKRAARDWKPEERRRYLR